MHDIEARHLLIVRATITFVVLVLGGCSASERPADRADAAVAADADTRRDSGEDGGATCGIRCGPLATCCRDGQECVVDRCLDLCAGSRCGADDGLCCALGELCVGGGCITPGDSCSGDDACPTGSFCEPLVGRCIPIPGDAECRYIPPEETFDPVVQWEHTRAVDGSEGGTLLTYARPPIVVNTTDDNGDGRVDALDVPEVIVDGEVYLRASEPPVFGSRPLVAYSGDDGRELWRSPDQEWSVPVMATPAAADLDGDGEIEIASLVHARSPDFSSTEPHVGLFDHRGVIVWVGTEVLTDTNGKQDAAIADLDEDGDGEVIVSGNVYDKAGVRLWSSDELTVAADSSRSFYRSSPVIADVDGDGRKELFASHVAYRFDGTELWRRPANIYKGHVAIGRFLEGPGIPPGPQLVAVDDFRYQIIDARTGDSLLGPVHLGGAGGSGLPAALVVADFDGDGRSEIAMTRGSRLIVVDPRLTTETKILWELEARPTTGRPGLTVFDFDADGADEVVLSSYCTLRILRGADGSLIWHTSLSNTNEVTYPVVADVDNDGNAELIAYQNIPRTDGQCLDSSDLPYQPEPRSGLWVYRDRLDHWVPTRPIWNQLTYHLDNIYDDGSLPRHEAESWSTHNTYRVQRLVDPETVTLAPDLAVVALSADVTACPLHVTLRARVQNRGSRGVPAGVAVAFHGGGTPSMSWPIGVATTNTRLLSGEATWVELEVDNLRLEPDRTQQFYAVVDEDLEGMGSHSECNELNNMSAVTTLSCTGPI